MWFLMLNNKTCMLLLCSLGSHALAEVDSHVMVIFKQLHGEVYVARYWDFLPVANTTCQLYDWALLETDLPVPGKPLITEILANIFATASWETPSQNSPVKPLWISQNSIREAEPVGNICIYYKELAYEIVRAGLASLKSIEQAIRKERSQAGWNPRDKDQSCCSQAVRKRLQASKASKVELHRHRQKLSLSLSLPVNLCLHSPTTLGPKSSSKAFRLFKSCYHRKPPCQLDKLGLPKIIFLTESQQLIRVFNYTCKIFSQQHQNYCLIAQREKVCV